MAPELHNHQDYTGVSVDLFALGIILFILHTGHPPFSKAKLNDPHYKWFVDNRADKFWRMHRNYQASESGPISAEFEDMITQMFQYNVGQRLEMADILGHDWFEGEMATPEDVQDEFRYRHEKILLAQQEEKERKEAQRNVRRQQAVGIARGEEDNKKLGTWDPKYHKGTEFFSTYEPHDIAEELDQQLAKLEGIDINSLKKDPKKWRLSFNVTRKVELPPVEQEAEEEGEEEESKVATAEV